MTATELAPFLGHICKVTTAEAEYTGIAVEIADEDALNLLEMVYPHPGRTAAQMHRSIPIVAIQHILNKEADRDIGGKKALS